MDNFNNSLGFSSMGSASDRSPMDKGYAWCILCVATLTGCFEQVGTPGIFYMAILKKFNEGKCNSFIRSFVRSFVRSFMH